MVNKRIACWLSEKKYQKTNWNEFETNCRQRGFELFKLDLNSSLENQEPFCVLLHKLTDIIASADQGDPNNGKVIKKVEDYLSCKPQLVVIDPIQNVRQLLNRYKCYSIINSTNLHNYDIFTPNFCELTESDNVSEKLKLSNITYPFICKPTLGHGSKEAHEMSIIFNENSLKDCKIPCVAQSFINHNAILFKIYIVANKYEFVERPSLKNFQASDQLETIHFDTSNVSKAGSQSILCKLDTNDERNCNSIGPDQGTFQRIARTLRQAFGMDLLGVDVVVENTTGKYAIIDVNAFPGYDGFPNFFPVLLDCIEDKLK